MANGTKIGWIGTGVMGVSMAGHSLTVFNRTRVKAQPLLDVGAQWAATPQAVAAEADVVFTMVGFPQDVRAVRKGMGLALETVSKVEVK